MADEKSKFRSIVSHFLDKTYVLLDKTTCQFLFYKEKYVPFYRMWYALARGE